MTDTWEDFHGKSTDYPFCSGSLYQEHTTGGQGRMYCRACDYSTEKRAGDPGYVPQHYVVGQRKSHHGQQLGRGRQLALWALLACPRDAYQVGAVLTDLCCRLGLHLDPSECFHPKMGAEATCSDCGMQPEDPEADGDDIPF